MNITKQERDKLRGALIHVAAFVGRTTHPESGAAKAWEAVHSAMLDMIDRPAASGDVQAEKTICIDCHGEGVVHTGIEEAPVTMCEMCGGSGKVVNLHLQKRFEAMMRTKGWGTSFYQNYVDDEGDVIYRDKIVQAIWVGYEAASAERAPVVGLSEIIERIEKIRDQCADYNSGRWPEQQSSSEEGVDECLAVLREYLAAANGEQK